MSAASTRLSSEEEPLGDEESDPEESEESELEADELLLERFWTEVLGPGDGMLGFGGLALVMVVVVGFDLEAFLADLSEAMRSGLALYSFLGRFFLALLVCVPS